MRCISKWPQITESRKPNLRTLFPTGTVCSFIWLAHQEHTQGTGLNRQTAFTYPFLLLPLHRGGSQEGGVGPAELQGSKATWAWLVGLGRWKGRKWKALGVAGILQSWSQMSHLSLETSWADTGPPRIPPSFTTQCANPLFLNDASVDLTQVLSVFNFSAIPSLDCKVPELEPRHSFFISL